MELRHAVQRDGRLNVEEWHVRALVYACQECKGYSRWYWKCTKDDPCTFCEEIGMQP